MPETLTRPLRGVIPPLVTPLRHRDALDREGLERLVERAIEGGVSGLFVLGTTGEGPSLSYRLRRELIDAVCRQAAFRVPVLVGITDTSYVESLQLAQHAARADALAVVLAPPYYLPAAQPELHDYVERLQSDLPLPLFLYNMPGLTKVAFGLDTVERLMELPGVVGIKDSSGDMTYFHQLRRLCRQREDWTLLIGPEELLAEATLLGGHGGVSGGANLHPELYVRLYEAAAAGDLSAVRVLQDQLLELGRIYRVSQHTSAIIRGLKCALSCLDICSDLPAEPFERCNDAERRQIQACVDALQWDLAAYAVKGSKEPGHASGAGTGFSGLQ